MIDLAIGLVALLWASFFATADEAFARLSPGRVAKLVAEGAPRAERLVDIAADKAPTLSTIRFFALIGQVALIVALVDLCRGTGWSVGGYLLAAGLAVAIVFTGLTVGAGTLGRQHSSQVALKTAGLMRLLTAVFFFVPQIMIWIGNLITPGRGFPEGPFTSEDELRQLVDQAEASNQIEADERRMIHSVFDLGDTLVREVMVPRTEVVYIEQSKTLRQALSLALRSGFSRIPVVGPGGIDDVVGIAYLKDIVKRVFDDPDAQAGEQVTAILRPAVCCPDSKPADDLLREMQTDRIHLVVVVDEFGGTAGIVAIEDILEEIVGEIVDEYDDEIAPITDLGDGSYKVVARLSLDDLGDLFGLELDDAEVDSVGGVLAKVLNQVPIPGAQVVWEGLELRADQPVGRRHQVGTVLVRRWPGPEPEPRPGSGSAASPVEPGPGPQAEGANP
ncbi:MAG: hemolysin family protein [Propionibacteriaceae bacterium]|jgi:CBS domain containing-hemolysin-like protein|nr:hemolysin family protein [Propionibacteriaceae bacterium]